MRTALLGLLLAFAFVSCAPLPYRIEDKLSPPTLEAIQARYHGKAPLTVTYDERTEHFVLTKAARDAWEHWYGDRAGFTFPIGHTFAAYLSQVQPPTFPASAGAPLQFTASLVDGDISYTMRYVWPFSVYIDWVALTLTIDTFDAAGQSHRLKLTREVSIPPEKAQEEERDLALKTVLFRLVLDYLDALLRAATPR